MLVQKKINAREDVGCWMMDVSTEENKCKRRCWMMDVSTEEKREIGRDKGQVGKEKRNTSVTQEKRDTPYPNQDMGHVVPRPLFSFPQIRWDSGLLGSWCTY